MDSALGGLLGLARKAGKLQLGEEQSTAAALEHKARLILIASDASEHTAQRTLRAAGTGNAVCLQTELSKAELGSVLGRAGCAVVAVTDVGLAASVVRKLAQTDPQRYAQAEQQLTQKAEKNLRRKREKIARRKAAGHAKPWVPPPQ